MSSKAWRPSAEIVTLKARSQLLATLRAFFHARDYFEVETAAISRSGTVDRNIDSIRLADDSMVLHTSPEFQMKRLLAAGSGPIYQIAHVYREEESGRFHNPEFTMLEWYRPGFDHQQLMDEVEVLLSGLVADPSGHPFGRYSYADCFRHYLNIDPHICDLQMLENCAVANGITVQSELTEKDQWLDLLMGEVIGPQLGQKAPEFIFDYPASQASLARIREGTPSVAERFELYWRGIELANGFHELNDAAEQRLRLEAEASQRLASGKFTPAIDECFLQALESGLPDCAGVALGVDRLLMLMLDKKHISEVLSFAWDRV